MKVVGLNQKEYSLNLTRYNRQREDCSSLHLRARILLKKLFPYDLIFEEVVLVGTQTEINYKPLMLDFYINSQKLAIEVQGSQHYKFNSFFHTNKLEFFRSRKLDKLKKQWCKLNNIRLIELPYNNTDEEWVQIIKEI